MSAILEEVIPNLIMTMRNLFVLNRYYKVVNTVSQIPVCSPPRSPVNQIDGKVRNFSTTLVNNECIKFKNHDDFVKKVFVENDLPVVVNFHADWCEPSKKLTESLRDKLEGRKDIALVIVNVESNIDLVNTFEVKAVPAVLAIKNGLVVYKSIGLVDSNVIEDILDKMARKGKPKTT